MPRNFLSKTLENQLRKNNQAIIPVVPELLDATTNLGKGEIEIPKEITEIEALIYSRGRLNAQFFRENRRKYVVPDWVNGMLSFNSPGVISLGHSSSLINSNYRDWVAFGGLDCESEGTVTSKGLVVPLIDGYGILSGAIINNEPQFITRDGKSVQKLQEGYLPIIINSWSVKRRKYQQIVYGGKVGTSEMGVLSLSKKKSQDSAELIFSIRPFNQEGVSLIHSIAYRPQDQSVVINKELAVQFSIPPERIASANYHFFKDSATILSTRALKYDSDKETVINCPVGLANMTFVFPSDAEKIEAHFRTSKKPFTPPPVLEKVTSSWKEKINRGVQFNAGDSEVNRLYLASLTNLLLLADPGTITPGPTEYHRFWCRDAAYLISALDRVGYHQYAEEALDQFIQRQRKDGFYYSHEGEFDSNGEGIWVLSEHAKLAADQFWLEKVFDSIKKAAEWLIKTRNQKKEEPLFGQGHLVRGLLPPGYSAEHLGACDYFYWDNFWGVAGLREAARCAKELDDEESHIWLQEEYQKYHTDLLSSIDQLYEKHGFLPVGPYREGDSAMIANLCAWHPTKIFDAKNDVLMKTAEKLYEEFTHKGGFMHEVAWNCYGTYLTMHLAQVYLENNDQKKVSQIINWLVKHQTCPMGWAEGISPQTMRGGMGDSPHGWASADWIHLIRNLFVCETTDGAVKLLSGFPVKFLKKGVSTSCIKTHYGEIDYHAKLFAKKLTLKLKNTLRIPTIRIMTPRPITSIKVNAGETTILDDKCAEISQKATEITINLAK
ncbi:MAG: hypothetical protein GF308_14920 [Candidatus Heimdallarchaeota archaeon]|nr:hypothetical protein [Candidatus Heimdallarchaeota archaeon]